MKARTTVERRRGGSGADPIFQPLRFRNLTIKNRVIRSSISGRFDNYDGSGAPVRANWELEFARGGVGAIVSAQVPVDSRATNMPNYAFINTDGLIPFWREIGERVHEHDCRYILQLAHAGRQRDIRGFLFAKGLSSTSKSDPLHGFPCERMTLADIRQARRQFTDGARRAREAGLDGIEIHAAHGYLFTQFLSSAVNDRDDAYGGKLRNRARLLLEVVRDIRAEVGEDFHLQVKISATEYANAFLPWLGPGNTIADSTEVCRWLEEGGVDAIHVSTGSTFPHPRNPPGEFPAAEAAKTYHTMLDSGSHTLRNYFIFRTFPLNVIFEMLWKRGAPRQIEGLNLDDARALKQVLGVPVICTGGFQSASLIRRALRQGSCDVVSIARPLIANPDLVNLFRAGHDLPPRPCTFCNKCLFNALENPLGCYEESRYESREEMVRTIMQVYQPRYPVGNGVKV